MSKYTKHLVFVCGGLDTEIIYVKHSIFGRKIIHNPTQAIIDSAEEGEELDADLSSSISICTGGRPLIIDRT
jgi:hypothetical protein